MMLQSIVNSYFNQYLTDTLGFTVNRGLWIASFMVMFPVFFDIDKVMPEVTKTLIDRKRAECEAKGIPYVSPEEQQRAEIEKQQIEAEEIRIRELKETCAKKGLDFDTENQKYLDKKAKRDAKKAAKKAKKAGK